MVLMKATLQVCFHLRLVEGTKLADRARKHHPVHQNKNQFNNKLVCTQLSSLTDSHRGKLRLTFPGNPSASSFLGACPGLGLETVCLAEPSSPLDWLKLSTRAGFSCRYFPGQSKIVRKSSREVTLLCIHRRICFLRRDVFSLLIFSLSVQVLSLSAKISFTPKRFALFYNPLLM